MVPAFTGNQVDEHYFTDHHGEKGGLNKRRKEKGAR